MYVCFYVCMYVCFYVCIYIYICVCFSWCERKIMDIINESMANGMLVSRVCCGGFLCSCSRRQWKITKHVVCLAPFRPPVAVKALCPSWLVGTSWFFMIDVPLNSSFRSGICWETMFDYRRYRSTSQRCCQDGIIDTFDGMVIWLICKIWIFWGFCCINGTPTVWSHRHPWAP